MATRAGVLRRDRGGRLVSAPLQAAAVSRSGSRRYHTADEFIVARRPDWDQMRSALRHLENRQVAALGPENIQYFAQLHRAVSADLAYAQLRFPRSPIVVELNELVARSHNALYAEPRDLWKNFSGFFAGGFPRVVRENARFVWIGAGLFVGAALAGAIWFVFDPNAAADAFGFQDAQFNEAEVPFTTLGEGIYAFVMIGLNNIQVAFLAFALGVLGCIGSGFLLAFNGLLIGVVGAQAYDLGSGADFMALVTPHGVLEITVIVLSGAAGMRIGWAVIAPGRRKRRLAVAEAGGDAVRILIGTIPLFVLAAAVEGFVTPAGWPIEVNVAFGWLLGILTWLYLGVAGRGELKPAA